MGSAPSSPSLSLESTGSTPSLESPSKDSLSTIFAFFEALPSLVDMVQGLYNSLGVVVLVVSVAPGIARNPTRRVQQQQCVQSPRTSTRIYIYYLVYSLRTHMCTRYHLHMIPGTCYIPGSYVIRNRSWLSSARYEQFYKKLKNVSCEYNRLNGWNSTNGKSSCWPWQHPGESPTYILHKDKTSNTRERCFV